MVGRRHDCDFVGNRAFYYGGGVHNQSSPARISGCYLERNVAYMGGGVANSQNIDGMGAPFIEACEFKDNEAVKWDDPGSGIGGAMATVSGPLVFSSEVNVENCLFHLNSAGNPAGSTLLFYTARRWCTAT